MPAGAPPKFTSPDDLQEAIDGYFESIKGEYHMEEKENPDTGDFEDVKVWDRAPEPATITGLCLFLGFESRQSFHDYGKHKKYSYTIKKARLRIENAYEVAMNYAKNPTGQIFALKNLGWADRQEVDHTTAGEKIETTKIIFGANDV